MGTLPHSIGHYLELFDAASKESPQAGAEVFVGYVNDQKKGGGFETTKAFNICVQNIDYGLGNLNIDLYKQDADNEDGFIDESAFPDDERLAIQRAREMMAEELTK